MSIQAAINRAMRPWDDQEIARFTARAAAFERAGMPAAKAQLIADRLALRDQQGDDRTLCIECLRCTGERCRARQPMLRLVFQRCGYFVPGVTS